MPGTGVRRAKPGSAAPGAAASGSTVAVLAAAVLVAAFVVIGGGPAVAAPPAPVDVTIGWSSAAHTAVVVTWRDPGGPVANAVSLRRVEDNAVWELQAVAADAPDRVEVSVSWLNAGTSVLRIEVTAVDSDGSAGPPASSPAFDTSVQGLRFTRAEPRFDTSFDLAWRPWLDPDTTPGDPLDLPPTPVRYTVYASHTQAGWDLLRGPSDATQFVVPAPRGTPYWIEVIPSPNEWGRSYDVSLRPVRTTLTTDIPARATSGRPVVVTGRADHVTRICDPGVCWQPTDPAAMRAVTLEARAGTAGPWRTAARVVTGRDGAFRFAVAAGPAGMWQYRVVAPNLPLVRDDGGAERTRLAFGVISRPVTTVVATAAGAGRDSAAQRAERQARQQRSAEEQRRLRERWASR